MRRILLVLLCLIAVSRPAAAQFDSRVGAITSTYDPRQIQLGVKVNF